MQDKLAALRHKQQITQLATLEKSVIRALEQTVRYLDGKTSKTEVVNQLKEIGTPDALKVVEAVNGLHTTLKTHKNTDLSEVSSLLKELINKPHQEVKIPEQKDSVSVSNLKDVDFSKLEKAIKDLRLDGPTVNVDAPDLSPIKSGLSDVVNAIKAIVIPKPQTMSTTKLETEAEKTNKILTDQTKKLQEIVDKPVGGGGGGGNGTPYVNPLGKATYVQVDSDGNIPIIPKNGLLPFKWDDLTFSNADVNGNYQTGTVKSAAATVATLEFTYDGSSKLTRVRRL